MSFQWTSGNTITVQSNYQMRGRMYRVIKFFFQTLWRALLSLAILGMVATAGFVGVQASRPVGVVGGYGNVPKAELEDTYWELVADSLTDLREAEPDSRRARLVFLAIAVPFYPPAYTYIALYPESVLARHAMPDPLIPEPIAWRDAPATWWRLVMEMTWMGTNLVDKQYH